MAQGHTGIELAQASGLMEALYRDRQSQRAAQPATGTARLEELQDGKCPASKDGRTPGPRQGHSPGVGQGKSAAPIAAYPDPSEIRTPVRATTNRSKLKTSNPVDPLGAFFRIITALPQTSATISGLGRRVSPPGRDGPGCQVPSRRSGPFRAGLKLTGATAERGRRRRRRGSIGSTGS